METGRQPKFILKSNRGCMLHNGRSKTLPYIRIPALCPSISAHVRTNKTLLAHRVHCRLLAPLCVVPTGSRLIHLQTDPKHSPHQLLHWGISLPTYTHRYLQALMKTFNLLSPKPEHMILRSPDLTLACTQNLGKLRKSVRMKLLMASKPRKRLVHGPGIAHITGCTYQIQYGNGSTTEGHAEHWVTISR